MIPTDNTDSTQVDFDFRKEQHQINKMIGEFSTEINATHLRRTLRENKVNVIEKRADKTILPDETIIPNRTIDINIRAHRDIYLNYVTTAERALIITDVYEPSRHTDQLELWFTRGMRYPRWRTDWTRLIDSLLLHGGAAFEVVYDPTKPFNCGIEFIPRECLIIPIKCKGLQSARRILRKYEITALELEEMAEKYQFNPAGVKAIQERSRNMDDCDLAIYKQLCKKDGIVYNAWYSEDFHDDWLRAPQPHDIGLIDFDYNQLTQIMNDPMFIQPGPPVLDMASGQLVPSPSLRDQLHVPLTLKMYPVTWFEYEETENLKLLEAQGRAGLDINDQEALTHLWTSTVNSAIRASKLYASTKEEPGEGTGKWETATLQHGGVYSKPLTFFQAPWPQSIILTVLQALSISNAKSAGQTDVAAMARPDANKTKYEMETANEMASQQESTRLGIFGSPYLEVYALAFEIARHQAIFDLCPRPQDMSILIGAFNFQPAGDVEVIKRAQEKQNAQQFFELVRGTPAAEKLLVFLLNKFFPDQAAEWGQALISADKDQLILQLVNVLRSIPTDGLPPEQLNQLQALIAAAQSVVGGPDNAGAIDNSGTQTGTPAPTGDATQQTPGTTVNP